LVELPGAAEPAQPKALRKSTALLMLPAALVIFTLPIVMKSVPWSLFAHPIVLLCTSAAKSALNIAHNDIAPRDE
jgi:hypothetical protein